MTNLDGKETVYKKRNWQARQCTEVTPIAKTEIYVYNNKRVLWLHNKNSCSSLKLNLIRSVFLNNFSYKGLHTPETPKIKVMFGIIYV